MKIRPYFNSLQGGYQGRQPPFYRAGEVAGVPLLESSFGCIREELAQNLSDPATARICFRKNSLKKVSGWRQIELKVYGLEYPERVALFPRTMEILRSIPGMSTAYFSVLAPHTRIPPHLGETDAFYRVHLGIKIPASLPECGIEVAGEKKSWTAGGCLAFNDAYYHCAWNDTEEERIVLIIDILRPEFMDEMMYVNAGVRATLYHARIYELLFPVIELMPRILTRLLLPAFRYLSFGYHLALHEMKNRCGRLRRRDEQD